MKKKKQKRHTSPVGPRCKRCGGRLACQRQDRPPLNAMYLAEYCPPCALIVFDQHWGKAMADYQTRMSSER